MKSFNLSNLKPENKKLLVRPAPSVKEESVVTEKPKKKSGKVGRPMIESEPLNRPVTINFTASEWEKIKKKAGRVSVSVYLRDLVVSSN